MARTARQTMTEGIYQISCASRDALLLFHAPQDYQRYLQLVLQTKAQHRIALYHYCLIRTRVALVLGIPNGVTLSKLMQRVQHAYRWYHHQRYGTTGRLWQGRFRSHRVPVNDVVMVGQHLELQPVQIGLVLHPAEYPYSSYHALALGHVHMGLDMSPAYMALGSTRSQRQRQYHTQVQQQLPQEVIPS